MNHSSKQSSNWRTLAIGSYIWLFAATCAYHDLCCDITQLKAAKKRISWIPAGEALREGIQAGPTIVSQILRNYSISSDISLTSEAEIQQAAINF